MDYLFVCLSKYLAPFMGFTLEFAFYLELLVHVACDALK